jgi:hypothetical protein
MSENESTKNPADTGFFVALYFLRAMNFTFEANFTTNRLKRRFTVRQH